MAESFGSGYFGPLRHHFDLEFSSTWNISPPSDRNGFELAILCALPLEADAVIATFDKIWSKDGIEYGKAPGDLNAYTTGVIGNSNVVLAHLSRMGKVSATEVAANLNVSFQNIKLALVVGICGGVPKSKSGEIYLGDIVISKSLIQYDFGKQYPHEFHTLDTGAGQTTIQFRNFMAKLQTEEHRNQLQHETQLWLKDIQPKLQYSEYPTKAEDILFDPSYNHMHLDNSTCDICDAQTLQICSDATTTNCNELGCEKNKIIRTRIQSSELIPPSIYFGKVGSGDRVVKSGIYRDELAKKHDIIAFEMEGAGVWQYFPSLVIKSVADYADSHKNKDWQAYAAATAAACTKALLITWKNTLGYDQREIMSSHLMQSIRIATPGTGTNLESFKTSSTWTSVQNSEDTSSQPRYIDTNFISRLKVTQFVGRELVLEDIDYHFLPLFHSNTTSPISLGLIGMGGIGKTQLAIQYCWQSFDRLENQFHTVLWINASSEDSVLTSIAHISTMLTSKSRQFDSIQERVRYTLDEFNKWTKPYLIIYDNFDDPGFENIIDYLPSRGPGALLFTSRLQDIDGFIGSTINTPLMDSQESLDLLLLKTKRENLSIEEMEAASNVVTLLGHLPLAIDQAAAYITHGSAELSFKEFIRHYDLQRETILKSVPRFWKYRDITQGKEKETTLSVLTTWDLSLRKLGNGELDHEYKSHFLTLLAFFDSTRISRILFEVHCLVVQNWKNNNNESPEYDDHRWMEIFLSTGFDDLKFRSVVSELKNLSLIRDVVSNEPESFYISLHPLVRDWAMFRIGLESQKVFTQEAMLVMSNVLESITSPIFDTYVSWLIPRSDDGVLSSSYGSSVREMTTEIQSHLHRIYLNSERFELSQDQTFTFYRQFGDFLSASEAYDKALVIYNQFSDYEEISSDNFKIKRLSLMVKQNHTFEAKDKVLDFINQWPIDHDPKDTNIMILHSIALRAASNVSDGKEVEKQADLLIKCVQEFDDELAILIAADSLRLIQILGLWSRSKVLLEFVESRITPSQTWYDDIFRLANRAKLALIQSHTITRNDDELEKIESYYTNQLETYRQNSDHERFLETMAVISDIQVLKENWIKAIEFIEPRYAYVLEILGPAHESAIGLGQELVWHHLRAYPDQPYGAKEIFDNHFEKCTTLYGENHRNSKLILSKFASTFTAEIPPSIAIDLFEQLFAFEYETLEEMRTFLPSAIEYSVLLLDISDNTDDHFKAFEQIANFVMRLEVLVSLDPTYEVCIQLLLTLGIKFYTSKRLDQVTTISNFLYDNFDQISDPTLEANILRLYKICKRDAGNYEIAIQVGRQLIEHYTSTNEPNNEEVLVELRYIAETYTMMSPKRIDEAIKTYESLREKNEALYGATHSSTIDILMNIAILKMQIGNFEDSVKIGKNLLEWSETNLESKDYLNYQILNIIITSLAHLGDVAEADKFLSRSTSWLDKYCHESDEYYTNSRAWLAICQNLLNKWEESEINWRIYFNNIGDQLNDEVINFMDRFSSSLANLNKWEESRDIRKKINDWQMSKYGQISPECLNALGYAEFELGNYQEACSLLQQGLSLWDTNSNPSGYAYSLVDVARCLFQLEQYDLAEDMILIVENHIQNFSRSGLIFARIKFRKEQWNEALDLYEKNLSELRNMDQISTKLHYNSWKKELEDAAKEFEICKLKVG